MHLRRKVAPVPLWESHKESRLRRLMKILMDFRNPPLVLSLSRCNRLDLGLIRVQRGSCNTKALMQEQLDFHQPLLLYLSSCTRPDLGPLMQEVVEFRNQSLSLYLSSCSPDLRMMRVQ